MEETRLPIDIEEPDGSRSETLGFVFGADDRWAFIYADDRRPLNMPRESDEQFRAKKFRIRGNSRYLKDSVELNFLGRNEPIRGLYLVGEAGRLPPPISSASLPKFQVGDTFLHVPTWWWSRDPKPTVVGPAAQGRQTVIVKNVETNPVMPLVTIDKIVTTGLLLDAEGRVVALANESEWPTKLRVVSTDRITIHKSAQVVAVKHRITTSPGNDVVEVVAETWDPLATGLRPKLRTDPLRSMDGSSPTPAVGPRSTIVDGVWNKPPGYGEFEFREVDSVEPEFGLTKAQDARLKSKLWRSSFPIKRADQPLYVMFQCSLVDESGRYVSNAQGNWGRVEVPSASTAR